MATVLEKPIFTSMNNPPEEQNDQQKEDYEDPLASTSCCSWLFCFRRNSSTVERRFLLSGETRETWWTKKMKSVKETSELLAGPKWKNFIRRFSCYSTHNKRRRSQFQYDPFSYALNFDGGPNEEEDESFIDFSTRFTCPTSRNNTGELVSETAGLDLNRS